MSDAMKEEIRQYIIGEYIEDEAEAEELEFDSELIDTGLIDSFSITSIRNWLEKKYKVRIPDELGTVMNFRSIERIASLVSERKNA